MLEVAEDSSSHSFETWAICKKLYVEIKRGILSANKATAASSAPKASAPIDSAIPQSDRSVCEPFRS